MEPFAVLSASLKDNETFDYISSVSKERYGQYKKAHHEWINEVEQGKYRNALNQIRTKDEIFSAMHEKFPNSTIEPVTECDEVYWSASPKEAKGSDRALVDCHYDAPFSIIPTGGVVYYRIIIAINENNTVTTIFPDENKKVKMNKGDFHGLDYNKDWHCVDGSILPDTYRVLLKMHYLIIPNGVSRTWVDFVRYINVQWTFGSRVTMRMSADPQTFFEQIVALIVNVCRFIFNNTNSSLITALFFILVAVVVGLRFGRKRFRKLL